MSTRPTPHEIGRYRSVSRLGTGGFASVIKAHDDRLDTAVAIKLLSPRHAEDPDIRERFVREAQLLRRVDSPHVVAVYDIDEVPDGRPYMVMAFAGGGTVADRFEARSDADAASIDAVMEALGSGLDAMHRAGVVHRDIKPENLLIAGSDVAAGATRVGMRAIAADERVLIGDLGLAKDQRATSMGPTILGGTPHYQSPEQRQHGAEITEATDTFAASAVLWFCLTGQDPPLADELEWELPTIPEQWRGFFTQGLHIEPERRFTTARAWHAAAANALGVSNGVVPSGIGGSGSGSRGAATSLADGSTSGVAATDIGGPGFVAAAPGATCPYKGLAAFQPEDAGLFFGRDELVAELVARLQAAPTLVIGGPSGSGKSSLLRAGLIPLLRTGALPGSQHWKIALFSPGPDPLEELAFQLEELGGSDAVLTPERLREAPHTAKRWVPGDRDVVLAIDQFEELFTQSASEEDRASFLSVLESLTSASHARTRVVASMRADFYDRAAHHPWLADRINANQVLVGPMRQAELREAIERPAERVGLRLEPGLADHILEDLGSEAGRLPLLAHAMVETWLRRRGNTLTLEGYRAAGGVAGAIANRAEETHGRLDPDRQAALRSLMLLLITPGEGAADTRRRIRWSDLDSARGAEPGSDADRACGAASDTEPDTGAGSMVSVADALVEARLLTSSDDSVEITHEALLSTWPRLRQWIDESRDDLRTRQRILAASEEWMRSERTPDLLYRGATLASACEWMRAQDAGVGAAAREFLTASEDAEAAETAVAEQAEQRRRRFRRRATAGLAALTVAALIATAGALVALRQSRASEADAEVAFARALAAVSDASAEDDPLLALALANESMARATPPTAESRAALVRARSALASGARLLHLGSVEVPEADTVVVSPDGSLLVVGDKTGMLSVYDTASRELVGSAAVHDGGIQEAVFDSAGEWLATTGNDGALRLTLIDTVAADASPDVRTLAEIDSIGWSVSFSPDGSELAWSTENRGVIVFDPVGGLRMDTAAMEAGVDYITVAHTGDRILAGRGDGMIDVYDGAAGHELLSSYAAHGDGNDTWEIVRSGALVASVGSEGNANLWDLAQREPAGQLVGAIGEAAPGGAAGLQLLDTSLDAGLNDDRVLAVLGDRDGQVHVAEVGRAADGTVEAFRVIETSRLHHDLPVLDGSLSADGSVYASLAQDQVVRLWAIDRATPAVMDTVAPLAEPVDAMAMSGSMVAWARASEGAGVIGVVDTDGAEVGEWPIDHEPTALRFVPTTDETLLVVGTSSGELLVADPVSGETRSGVASGQGFITDIEVDASGRLVVAGSGGSDGNGRVVAWELGSGGELRLAAEAASHGREARQVALTPDDTIVSVGGGTVQFADADGSAAQDSLSFPDAVAVSVSPDGRWLAVGDNAEIVHLLDREAPGGWREVRHRLAGHDGSVIEIGFLADGQSLAVLSGVRGVLLWDLETGTRLGPSLVAPGRSEADGPGDGLEAMAVAPDGEVWLAGDALQRLTVLDAEAACEATSSILDIDRRTTFLGGDEPRSC